MRPLALAVLLAAPLRAASPYDAPRAVLKSVAGFDAKTLDALLLLPDDKLAADAWTHKLEDADAEALQGFRGAAEALNDGFLFGARPAVLDEKAPIPQFFDHMQLLRLTLLDARLRQAQGRRREAEADLLAAAGFLVQLTGQRYGGLISGLVEALVLEKSLPALARSARDPRADPAYLRELAARLDRTERGQDFLAAAFVEEGERLKGTLRSSVNPAAAAREQAALPFWRRWAASRLEDGEFFAAFYRLGDALADERTRVLLDALRANAPERYVALCRKTLADAQAVKAARERRGAWRDVSDGFKADPAAKASLAEYVLAIMMGASMLQYERVIARYHVYRSELAVLRAGLAVERFRRDRRRLPAALGELVPAYLPELPRDPFDGFGPLRYARDGRSFRVYGLGPGRRDEGGATVLDAAAFADDPARASGNVVFAD